MASLHKDTHGYRLKYSHQVNKRKVARYIRLGRLSKKKAEGIQRHVEELVDAKSSGLAMDAETARWLGKIGDSLHAKLAAKGLVDERKPPVEPEPVEPEHVVTLGPFIDSYIDSRKDVEPRTVICYK